MQKLILGLTSLGLTISTGIVQAGSGQKGNFESQYMEEKAKTNIVTKTTEESSIYTQGPTVTTSPYLGIRSAYDASDLIVNLPTMNEDLRFLEEELKLNKHLQTGHLPYVDRPLIELSGDVVGQGYWASAYRGASRHDINLTNARFDVFARASSWALAYISINYDNAGVDELLQGSGFRLGNSRVFLDRGFLTIGNLEVAPVYFSLGQMFVPFGRYATSAVTTPMTVALGQTNARAAVLGFSYEGFYGSTYGFRGDSDVDSTGINQWGLNAGYRYQCDEFSVEAGAGYIANIADASGMQLTGHFVAGEFGGFGLRPGTEILEHRVPAYDLHAKFAYQSFGINAEFIGTTRHFAEEDMSFNDEGAKPSALHLEGNYRFQLANFPMAFALAYDHSTDALALNLPEDSFIATFNVSLWKNTIQSLEYRYDSNYDDDDASSGLAVAADGTLNTGAGPVGGGHRNLILAQIGVYF